MQLIKERSFQGLLGSGIITMEGWHCFERDNTGEEGGGREGVISQSLRKWQTTCQGPLLNSWPLAEKNVFFTCLVFYFSHSFFVYRKMLQESSNGEASVKYSSRSIDSIYLLTSLYSFLLFLQSILPIPCAKSLTLLGYTRKKPSWVNKRPEGYEIVMRHL